MGKKILICLNPFYSHFTPTLLVASKMRELGHTVTYLGFLDMEPLVTAYQFKYLSIKTCTNQDLSEFQNKKEYDSLAKIYSVLHQEIQTEIKNYQPDLVMIGLSRFLIYLLPCLNQDINVMFYSLCAGIPEINFVYPPITSDFVPAIYGKKNMISLLLWIRRYFRKGLAFKILCSHKYYPWIPLFYICKQHHIKWKFGIDGIFPDFPIVVFGSEIFEFELMQNNLLYFGLGITKKEQIEVPTYMKFKNQNRILVYCCLGTMSNRYIDGENFITGVINIFRRNQEWNLILSKGKRGETIEFHTIEQNIHIVNFVDQALVLQSANLAIIHGGHTTVKECIYYEVPMVVFSCSYDQNGNAARVHSHKIGVKNSILKRNLLQRIFPNYKKKIDISEIEELIKDVLNQEAYQINIKEIKKQIELKDELNNTIHRLFSIENNRI